MLWAVVAAFVKDRIVIRITSIIKDVILTLTILEERCRVARPCSSLLETGQDEPFVDRVRR